jgi:hypothetical protein
MGEWLARLQAVLANVAPLVMDGVVAVAAALAVVAAAVAVVVEAFEVLFAQAIAVEFENTTVLFCGMVGKLLVYGMSFPILSCDAVPWCSSR